MENFLKCVNFILTVPVFFFKPTVCWDHLLFQFSNFEFPNSIVFEEKSYK
jgi:hypothetical protein